MKIPVCQSQAQGEDNMSGSADGIGGQVHWVAEAELSRSSNLGTTVKEPRLMH